ncbi:MAG: Hsp20/alpha crystallin family protein [Candidatus Cloacimonadota bacterium]|nr:Hsp20/alpha crystallin family protein [Candidatus Cloacimonadota bacterium]
MDIIRYRPFKSLVNRFFEQDFMPHFLDRGECRIPVDVYEKGGEIHMDFELPGLSKKDISVELDRDTLIVSGMLEKDKTIDEENYYRRERSYGEFSRSFTIPKDIKEKDITASFEKGILKITFPKTREIEAKKKIEIK